MKITLWYLGLIILLSMVAFLVDHFVGGWAAFFVVIVPFSLVANGFIAEWEDKQPGGFNNPPPAQSTKDDDTDDVS